MAHFIRERNHLILPNDLSFSFMSKIVMKLPEFLMFCNIKIHLETKSFTPKPKTLISPSFLVKNDLIWKID